VHDQLRPVIDLFLVRRRAQGGRPYVRVGLVAGNSAARSRIISRPSGNTNTSTRTKARARTRRRALPDAVSHDRDQEAPLSKVARRLGFRSADRQILRRQSARDGVCEPPRPPPTP
jgi:hypothetical protein